MSRKAQRVQTSGQNILYIFWQTWIRHLYTSDDHDILESWFTQEDDVIQHSEWSHKIV